jgi:small subunit ribosomal protein S7
MVEVKMFNKWGMDNIIVDDMGLKNYISLKPVIVPRTGARNAKSRFHNANVNIVERLINKMMIPGHKAKKHFLTSGRDTGKAMQIMQIVEKAFKILEQKTKENPVKVFVKAVENAAPREEVVAITYGGARYAKAIEMSPQRRVDFALRMIVQGAFWKSFGKKIGAAESLADEIINCYRLSNKSNAISKKLELERQADSSR